uniref:Uncharacterized protein n=1 Tax=Arundo donax TaxID=35708 RepID=A0A0A8Z3N3_ARUDO
MSNSATSTSSSSPPTPGCIAIAWATCCVWPGSRTRRPCSTSCAARTWP